MKTWNKNIRFIIICLGLLLAGCSSEQQPEPQEGQAITLAEYTSQPLVTRADSSLLAELSIPLGKSIGVYAYYHDNSTWAVEDDAGRTVPNFMFNQQAINTGTGKPYSYAPRKYWPNEEEDKLSFIAYYPYCDGTEEQITAYSLTPNLTNTGTGLPTFDFAVKDTVKEQVDFMVSDLLADLPKSRATDPNPGNPFDNLTITDRVRFLFKHATSKIEFRVKVDEEIRKDISYFTLRSMAITNIYNEGTLTPAYTPPVPPATEGTTTLNWAPDGSKTYYCKTTEAYLLMPQTLRDEAELIINYDLAFKSEGTTYTYDDKGNPVAVEEYIYNNRHSAVQLNTLKLSSSGTELTEWLPNHHYVYLIHIGAKRIDFTGIVVDWENEEIWNDIEVDEMVLPSP